MKLQKLLTLLSLSTLLFGISIPFDWETYPSLIWIIGREFLHFFQGKENHLLQMDAGYWLFLLSFLYLLLVLPFSRKQRWLGWSLISIPPLFYLIYFLETITLAIVYGGHPFLLTLPFILIWIACLRQYRREKSTMA